MALDAPYQVGEIVAGRYTLREILGAGPIGLVYRADDGVMGVQVVLKVIAPDLLPGPETQRRFLQDVVAARAVQHRFVARLFDAFVDRGQCVVSMQYLAGTTLRRGLELRAEEGKPFQRGEAQSILSQMGVGLSAIHKAGLVHGNVKPENAIIMADAVRLADLGVATALAPTLFARAEAAAAADRYVAPEVRAARRPERRSDVFSLAAVAAEMLGIAPWGQQRADVPSAVDEVLRQAQAARPEERFADVDAFADALLTAMERGETRAARRTVARPAAEAASRGAKAEEPIHSRAEVTAEIEVTFEETTQVTALPPRPGAVAPARGAAPPAARERPAPPAATAPEEDEPGDDDVTGVRRMPFRPAAGSAAPREPMGATPSDEQALDIVTSDIEFGDLIDTKPGKPSQRLVVEAARAVAPVLEDGDAPEEPGGERRPPAPIPLAMLRRAASESQRPRGAGPPPGRRPAPAAPPPAGGPVSGPRGAAPVRPSAPPSRAPAPPALARPDPSFVPARPGHAGVAAAPPPARPERPSAAAPPSARRPLDEGPAPASPTGGPPRRRRSKKEGPSRRAVEDEPPPLVAGALDVHSVDLDVIEPDVEPGQGVVVDDGIMAPRSGAARASSGTDIVRSLRPRHIEPLPVVPPVPERDDDRTAPRGAWPPQGRVRARSRPTSPVLVTALVVMATGLAAAIAYNYVHTTRTEKQLAERAEKARAQAQRKTASAPPRGVVVESLPATGPSAPATALAAAPSAMPSAPALRSGTCPSGMKKTGAGSGFCMAPYEYPAGRTVPRVFVSLAEARRACAADGLRLCRRAEWEEACRGPQHFVYPWGNRRKPRACNVRRPGAHGVARTGAFVHCKTRSGIYDLVGNVAEWVDEGVAKGGSVRTSAKADRCSGVISVAASDKREDLGFRCCADAGR